MNLPNRQLTVGQSGMIQICFSVAWVTLIVGATQEAKGTSEAEAKKAELALAINGDDPDANLTMGKYLAFSKGEWGKALPHLSKGSDPTLGSLAQKDLAGAKSGSDKVSLAEEWMAALKKYPKQKRAMEDRAAFWFAKAWPDVEKGSRERVREQLRRILQNQTVPQPTGATAPTAWKVRDASHKGGPTTKAAWTGKISYQIIPDKHQGHYYPLDQIIPSVPTGKAMELSAWVLTDGTDAPNDQIAVAVNGLGGKALALQFLSFPIDTPWWQKVEMTFEVPAGAVSATISLCVGSSAGSIFIDEVSLKVDGKELVKNQSFEEK